MNKHFIVKLKKVMAIFLLSGIMLLQIMPLTAYAAEVSLPNISLPNISLPEVSLPEVSLPNSSVSKVSLPEISLPNITLPTINLSGKPLTEVFSTGTPNPSVNPSAQGTGKQVVNPGVNAPVTSVLDSQGYKVAKFMYGLGMAKISLVNSVLKSGNNYENLNAGMVSYKYLGGITRGGLGLAVPSDSYGKLGLDVWQGVDYGVDIKDYYQKYQAYRALAQGAQTAHAASDVYGAASGADAVSGVVNVVRPLSKLTTGLAVVGIAVSGGEGIYNVTKAFQAAPKDKLGYEVKAVGNIGQMMLSAAPLAAACPPLAVGLAVAGGVLWAGSAIYSNRKKITEAAKGIGKAAKGIANFARGLFG